MSHPLVATPSGPSPLVQKVLGSGALEYGVKTVEQIRNGDVTEGLINGGAAGLATLGFMSDPLATLGAMGAGWVIEHCEPFRQALDWLAGNGDVVAAYAQTWSNVSGALDASADRMVATVAADTGPWRSTALDAYRLLVAAEAGVVRLVGVLAGGVAGAVEVAGVVVGTVRSIVRDLIADAVGQLIALAIESLAVVTMVGTVPKVIAKVAEWSLRISKWLRILERVIGKIVELCRKLDPMFDLVEGAYDKIKHGLGGDGGVLLLSNGATTAAGAIWSDPAPAAA